MRKRSNKLSVKFEKSPVKTRSVLKTSPHYKKMNPKYKGLNKNRGCGELDFFECADLKFDPNSNLEVIGAGTFGVLLRANTFDQGPVAVKFIFNINTKTNEDTRIDLERELAYSYYMGKIKVGPRVFDSFHYSFEFDEISRYKTIDKIMKNIESKYANYEQFKALKSRRKKAINIEIQCIVMEEYQMNCYDAILADYNILVTSNIIYHIKKILKLQIKSGMYCFDVKTQNYVVNIIDKDEGKVDVKMIDFGADFCTESLDTLFNYDKYPFHRAGLKDEEILYISNVIQVYMGLLFTCNKTGVKLDKSYVNNVRRLFFSDPTFDKLFKNNWESFIEEYLEHSYDSYNDYQTIPSNNVVWYSTGTFDKVKDAYDLVTKELNAFLSS